MRVYSPVTRHVIEKGMFLVLLTLALACADCFGVEPTWPTMREVEDSFVVDTRTNVDFVRPLYDISGTVRYVFVCKGGSDKYLDALEEPTGITYVGVLGCRLSEGKKEIESSLLAEDEVAPWHTRGQFHRFDEITGDCGDYPEYGNVRHFRLRGFELTLSETDLVFDRSNRLQSFKMHVSLRRDDRITSPRAEQPGYLTPYKDGRSCKTILKGNEPRMCRNWGKGGVWEPCKD
jgi:hypothetical protein